MSLTVACVELRSTRGRASSASCPGLLTSIPETKVSDSDVIVWDKALAPGYRKIGELSRTDMRILAMEEGLFLDPVYTAKSFAAVMPLAEEGDFPQGSRVCFVHTGGLATLSAHQNELSQSI